MLEIRSCARDLPLTMDAAATYHPVRECRQLSTRITRKLARTGPQIRLCVAHIRRGSEEQGLNEWLLGYHASNRAYLHDATHHGPQLSEGPTRNRQNCDVNSVLRHPSVRRFRWVARERFQS